MAKPLNRGTIFVESRPVFKIFRHGATWGIAGQGNREWPSFSVLREQLAANTVSCTNTRKEGQRKIQVSSIDRDRTSTSSSRIAAWNTIIAKILATSSKSPQLRLRPEIVTEIYPPRKDGPSGDLAFRGENSRKQVRVLYTSAPLEIRLYKRGNLAAECCNLSRSLRLQIRLRRLTILREMSTCRCLTSL